MLPHTLAIPALLFLLLILVLSIAIVFHPEWHQWGRKHKHPPGPKPLPIIGNLHMLGKLPHRTFQSLAQKYGPIMSFKLGQVQTIVVSSPEAAELFLKIHDTVFSSRPKTFASDYITYGSKGIVFTEYGDYWRNVRKLCTVQLLHASKIEMFAPLRRAELELVVESLRRRAAESRGEVVVDVHKVVAELIENVTYKMILGRSKDDRFDLKGLVHEALKLNAAFNLADYVPWLGVFDLQVCCSAVSITEIDLSRRI